MTKTTYDDVFGGPPKFVAPTLAPRLEDYTEIFGGFRAPRASSIPVLDLPVVDEDDVFFDVQSSGFDYDEVFGGFDALDSAVSFHDLMMDQSKGFSGGDVDSSDEAWTPAKLILCQKSRTSLERINASPIEILMNQLMAVWSSRYLIIKLIKEVMKICQMGLPM